MSSGLGGGGPEKAREFADARDDGHVVRLTARAHPGEDAMDAVLGAAGDLHDVVSLLGLALGERDPDPGVRVRSARRTPPAAGAPGLSRSW